MGAWGVGMQANDLALDVIDIAKEKGARRARTAEQVRTIFEKLWEEDDFYKGSGGTNLGLAEWFLDRGADLSLMRDSLLRIVDREARDTGTWRNPAARRAALERFRDRLMGRPVDADAIAEDNKPLLIKMMEDNP